MPSVALRMRWLLSAVSAATLAPTLLGAVLRQGGVVAAVWGELPETVSWQGCVEARSLLAAGYVYHVALLFVSAVEWELTRAAQPDSPRARRRRAVRSALLSAHLCAHTYTRAQLSASVQCGRAAAAAACSCCSQRGVLFGVGYGTSFAWVVLGLVEGRRGLSRGPVWLLAVCSAVFCAGLTVVVTEETTTGDAIVVDSVSLVLLSAGIWLMFAASGRAELQLVIGD
jgi:hypothetical protein